VQSTVSKLKLAHPGNLTVAAHIPYEPFEYSGADHKLTGFEVDLAAAVAKILGVTPKWVNTSSDVLFTTVSTNKVDIGAGGIFGYANTAAIQKKIDTRKKLVNFSKPYFDTQEALVINTSKAPTVKSMKDLTSKDTCALGVGSASADWSQAHLSKYGVTFKNYRDRPTMFQAVSTGQVDCLAWGYAPAKAAIKNSNTARIVQTVPSGAQLAFVLPKNRPAVESAINQALEKTMQNGTYKKIFKKYFPDIKVQTFN